MERLSYSIATAFHLVKQRKLVCKTSIIDAGASDRRYIAGEAASDMVIAPQLHKVAI